MTTYTGVQSLAFSEFCPSVTLECGQPGDEYGIQLATHYVEKTLHLEALVPESGIENKIDLYHTIGIAKIPEELDFSFNGDKADIEFVKGIETLNFEEISDDTLLGKVKDNITKPLIVINEEGEDIFDNYFSINDNNIMTKLAIVPAMLTTDKDIVRQDCLCYLMERYDLEQGEKILKDNAALWA